MSKELTEAWKAEQLENDKDYFVKTSNSKRIYPAHLYNDNGFRFCGNEIDYFPGEGTDIEVLSPCDYDHFVELTEKVKELEQDVKKLTNNYKLLEKQQAENLAHGQALVDEFGDFETLYEELQNLRSLLKECQKYFRYMTSSDMPLDTSFDYMDVKLLDRINAEIGESEEK